MVKPDDIPQDIWDSAREAIEPWLGPENQYRSDCQEQIAYTILAERKRCAQVLLTKHEKYPQDGVMWDSTYYDLYEEVLWPPR